MAIEIVMPRLGWTMETGQVVQWHKQDGDTVKAGDVLLEVEGDKAVTEVEAFDSGILRLPPDTPQPGRDIAVGTVLAYLVEPGERAPFESEGGAPALVTVDDPGDTPRLIEEETPARQPTRNGSGRVAASPRARRVAAELGVDWRFLAGSGATGRIIERDVRAVATAGAPSAPPTPSAPARVTPLVRRPAPADERAVAAAAQPAIPAAPTPPAPLAPVPTASPAAAAETGQPLSQMRRIIGTRMAESAHTAAPVTLTTDVDATAFVRVRDEFSTALGASGERVPTYTDLLVRLAALALREHPALNASLAGEQIVRHEQVHIGVAVDTERGLLVPVVRDAATKSVGQIAEESAELIARTRAGKATASDLHGGTFTITNLGMYGIDAFTPIINLPECAILGVGRIVPRPVVTDEASETIAVRKMMALSLTFDHRVVDGAPAARFLQRVSQFVAQPFLWLAR